MNTHPIDPQKPRAGFLVTIHRSAGSTTKYARDHSEMEGIVKEAQGRPTTRGIDVKTVAADV